MLSEEQGVPTEVVHVAVCYIVLMRNQYCANTGSVAQEDVVSLGRSALYYGTESTYFIGVCARISRMPFFVISIGRCLAETIDAGGNRRCFSATMRAPSGATATTGAFNARLL